jgi:hypothetical protein
VEQKFQNVNLRGNEDGVEFRNVQDGYYFLNVTIVTNVLIIDIYKNTKNYLVIH